MEVQGQSLQWKPSSPEHGSDHPQKQPRLVSVKDAVPIRVSGMVPSVGLGLGLGLGVGPSRGAFTFMQLQELEHQALIFKYLVAGIPVPVHLVLPIWKSIMGSPVGGAFQPSSFSGGGGGLCFDLRNSMEPEPGRCRRTDGKKWRCSKEVVPDHKYCEKHVHRGRNRSRKPVERQALIEPPPNPTTTTTTTNVVTVASAAATQLSISIPDGLSLASNNTTTKQAPISTSVSSSPTLRFSPTSVLNKIYHGHSLSESSSGSISKT